MSYYLARALLDEFYGNFCMTKLTSTRTHAPLHLHLTFFLSPWGNWGIDPGCCHIIYCILLKEHYQRLDWHYGIDSGN